MSEEKKDESWFSALGSRSKINPFALLLSFGLINIFSFVYHNNKMPLDLKIFALALSLFFFLLATFFEAYRIEKERELKEKGLA